MFRYAIVKGFKKNIFDRKGSIRGTRKDKTHIEMADINPTILLIIVNVTDPNI